MGSVLAAHSDLWHRGQEYAFQTPLKLVFPKFCIFHSLPIKQYLFLSSVLSSPSHLYIKCLIFSMGKSAIHMVLVYLYSRCRLAKTIPNTDILLPL